MQTLPTPNAQLPRSGLGYAFRACSLTLALWLGINPLPAQSTAEGTIAGHVRNAKTGANLEGAVVDVVGSTTSAITGRDGSFTLSRVPAGRRTLQVFYTGLETKSVDV